MSRAESPVGVRMTRRGLLAGAAAGLAAGSARVVASPGGRRRFRFLFWNDVHLRGPSGPGTPSRPPNYQFANEKAEWLRDFTLGLRRSGRPDFLLSGGDVVDGELPDIGYDLQALQSVLLDRLPFPFLPCVGNHENQQGEGIPAQNRAYDRWLGPQWHNYVFRYRGIGFVVIDSSGAHRPPDAVTQVRNEFARRALAKLADLPVLVVTHVPLVPLRDAGVLAASFGFPSWKVVDPGVLEAVQEHRDRVIAVLSGHLHLTGVRVADGIHHVCVTGTASYPGEFAGFDVFDDRIEMNLHPVPDQWNVRANNIHGEERHHRVYIDAEHPDGESYVRGNPSERRLSVPLSGSKRPGTRDPDQIEVFHEAAPGDWQTGSVPRWGRADG